MVTAYLTPAEADLFRRLSPGDQRHSLDVFWRLVRAGQTDRTLLAAALLHDIGKTAGRLRLWHRVAYVLLRRLWPGLLYRLAAPAPSGHWRHSLYILLHHQEIGARLLARTGSAARVVALVAGDPATGPEGVDWLRWADDGV